MRRFDYVHIVENGGIAAEDTPERMLANPAYMSLRQGETAQ